jgi:HK97 family phage major capsid protein
VWKGVSSAGVSWSFDAEGATVSDDSPTLAQPSVTVVMARGFIPYSIEVEQDYAGFQAEMSKLLAEGYDELLSDKLARGSGSGEPRGVITALDANTNVEVVVTTDGAFGSEDIFKVWKALPERFRANANWVMSVDVANRVKQFESGNGAIRFPEIANGQLMSRSLYTSSYFPDHTGTTGAENKLVVGDFSNYVVARRAGMRIELVPHLVDVTNNRPTGSRGFFAWGRVGGNSVVDESFRLLQNQ